MGVEDDDGDLAVAQYRQLVSLLHQAELPLGERHLDVLLISAHRSDWSIIKQETAASFRLYGLDNCIVVKIRQGSGKERQGMVKGERP